MNCKDVVINPIFVLHIDHTYSPKTSLRTSLQMLAAGHEWASAEILLENYLEGVKSR